MMKNDGREKRLVVWQGGGKTVLDKSSSYRSIAEDVAQEWILGLLNEERRGNPIPSWPDRLSEGDRMHVLRVARKVYKLVLKPFNERVQQSSRSSSMGGFAKTT